MTAPARVVPPTDKSAAVSARMMSSVRRCASQMATYGACVQAHMPDVTKGACEKELDALAACVFAAKER